MGRRPQAPRRLKVKSAGAAGVTLTWKAPRGGREARGATWSSATAAASPARSARSYVDRAGEARPPPLRGGGRRRQGPPQPPVAVVRARVPRSTPPPLTPARPPVPSRRRSRRPTCGSTLTAAMVDRLFWRAGFGPTPAQRDGLDRPRRTSTLVDWLLDTPPSLAPTSTPPLTGGRATSRSTRWPPRTSWSWSGSTACSGRSTRCASGSAFFWHRHWAVSRDDGIPAVVARRLPRPPAAVREPRDGAELPRSSRTR